MPSVVESARLIAEECLEEIKHGRRPEFAGEAINWGHLYVADVWEPLQIVIEECNSPKIAGFIFDRLVEAGFDPKSIDVQTDW